MIIMKVEATEKEIANVIKEIKRYGLRGNIN